MREPPERSAPAANQSAFTVVRVGGSSISERHTFPHPSLFLSPLGPKECIAATLGSAGIACKSPHAPPSAARRPAFRCSTHSWRLKWSRRGMGRARAYWPTAQPATAQPKQQPDAHTSRVGMLSCTGAPLRPRVKIILSTTAGIDPHVSFGAADRNGSPQQSVAACSALGSSAHPISRRGTVRSCVQLVDAHRLR